MRVTREHLRERLDAAWELNPDGPGGHGESYLAAAEALLPDAAAFGDPELLFETRIVYVDALRFKRWETRPREVGAEALGVLRSCLRMWSADPHRYGGVDVDNMWTLFYRYLDDFVRLHPEPADRVLRLIAELERHCPPDRTWVRYMLDRNRLYLARRRGDVAGIERLLLRLRLPEPLDEHVLPDMAAARDAVMWTRLGRHDRAIAALAPVLAGQVPRSDDVPHEDRLLMAYLHTGRVDEAVAAHRRTRARSGMSAEELAAHLEFCARTGNEERGLDVLHRNLRSIGHRCESVEDMWERAAVALLCRRVAEKGIDREWFEPCWCEDGEPGEECDWPPLGTYVDLFSDMRWSAVEFARHMAELDGTPHLLEEVEALLRADPVVERLELPPDDGPPAHLAPPRPSVHLAAADADGLRRELGRVRSMEPGEDRTVRLERVLQNAAAAGEAEVLAEVRFVLLDDLLRDGTRDWDTDLLFTLRELFRLRGERPDLLGADRLDAVWRAVPTALDRVLTRPGPLLRQIRDFLDLAELHRRPGTEDLHHVRWFRTEAAALSGDADAARAEWARFRELPPAGRYAERGAVLRSVRWWLDLDRDDLAFAAMEPLPAGGPDDREDYLLLPYLRAGHADRARDVHERTWRTAADPTAVTAHLGYCARTGELGHGREIIKRVSGLFHIEGTDDFPFDRLRLYAAAIRLCERLVAAGLDETWPRSSGGDRPAEPGWTFARLAGACRDDLRMYSWRWEEVVGTSFHTRAAGAIADDRQEED